MKKALILYTCLLFVISCDKKELPVRAYDRGDALTTQVEMGGDYKNQVWFSLRDNRIVSTNLKTDWDLAFEASPTGLHVMLNGAKAMRAFKTNYTTLEQTQDTLGYSAGSKADMPSGNLDSTAIGDWKADNRVYIIHRGYNAIGLSEGIYKLKIIAEDAVKYTFEYANMKKPEIKTGTVYKDGSRNFVAYSMSTHSQLTVEPKKEEYDLCFTQYTHLFYEPEIQYYQVTGVLHNSSNTKAKRISNKAFADIVLSDTAGSPLLQRRDAIGYDWKDFDLNANVYTVNTKICYIIKDSRGFFYKLHFIDFLNSSGIKGYPQFEFKKL